MAQHGGAELGHQVDELEEGGEPLKVTLFREEEAGAAGHVEHFLRHLGHCTRTPR